VNGRVTSLAVAAVLATALVRPALSHAVDTTTADGHFTLYARSNTSSPAQNAVFHTGSVFASAMTITFAAEHFCRVTPDGFNASRNFSCSVVHFLDSNTTSNEVYTDVQILPVPANWTLSLQFNPTGLSGTKTVSTGGHISNARSSIVDAVNGSSADIADQHSFSVVAP